MIMEDICILLMLFTLCLCKFGDQHEVKFEQTILAVGIPYYKLLMTLGKCKKKLIFEEERAWGKVKLNRVLDIYYKSSHPDYLVSRVEIIVVINNTDCAVYSQEGVGQAEFAATMFIPTHVSMIFYHLRIYSCSKDTPDDDDGNMQVQELNFREKAEERMINKLPFYLWPIRPDSPPHHMFLTNKTIVYDSPKVNEKKSKILSMLSTVTPSPLLFAFPNTSISISNI